VRQFSVFSLQPEGLNAEQRIGWKLKTENSKLFLNFPAAACYSTRGGF
jgi:hypothetical protein